MSMTGAVAIAYTGNPNGRTWSRIEYASWDAAIMASWNDGTIWGLHLAGERTYWGELWDRQGAAIEQRAPHEKVQQPRLLEATGD